MWGKVDLLARWQIRDSRAWLQMSQGAEEARGSRLRKIQGHDVQGGDATPDLPAGAVLEEARRGGPQSASPPSGFGPTRARQYGVL